ncbi:MAG: hypothetical protein LBI60_01020 [Bacteroidales bacterium]|jgi:hypothetical protein|nr:hypothetical protein [Bacteroidales bacterium]
MSDKSNEYGVDATGEFEGFVAQRGLINKIKDYKKMLNKNDNLTTEQKRDYNIKYDALADGIMKLSRSELDRTTIKHFDDLIERVLAQVEGRNEEFGGIVGFIIHHKIITLALLVLLVIFFVFFHK